MPQAGVLHQLLAMDPRKIVQQHTVLNWSSFQGRKLALQSPAQRCRKLIRIIKSTLLINKTRSMKRNTCLFSMLAVMATLVFTAIGHAQQTAPVNPRPASQTSVSTTRVDDTDVTG